MSAVLAMRGIAVRAAPVRHPVAVGVMSVAHGLIAVARVLRRTAERLDAWFAARAKARADSVALLAMSERELRDIGIDPARIGADPQAWRRDWVT